MGTRVQTFLDTHEERKLVSRACYDAAAFRDLYKHYFPRVYAYVSYRVRDVQEVEDIVAQTFLKVLDNICQFKYQGAYSFASWIFRIAHNNVIDFYRRSERQATWITDEDISDVEDNYTLPDKIVLKNEQIVQVYQLLSTLSPRRQEVICLKFFAGLRNTEIAKILRIDERAVASHLSRGLQDMYQRYTKLVVSANTGDENE